MPRVKRALCCPTQREQPPLRSGSHDDDGRDSARFPGDSSARSHADNFLPTAKRVEVLARLCAEGYAGKMVLSHDANCWSDLVTEDDKRRTRPHWHYTHISDDSCPRSVRRLSGTRRP